MGSVALPSCGRNSLLLKEKSPGHAIIVLHPATVLETTPGSVSRYSPDPGTTPVIARNKGKRSPATANAPDRNQGTADPIHAVLSLLGIAFSQPTGRRS